MVHRAPDSRLLTNLIANEKEYTKHLANLFPIAHSALASLSAYAAASPSSPARTIATLVDFLASADDALQRYNHAIETWRDQLQSVKDLEDDLSAILRDRDILVTRLIKVSKATREAHRSSRLITPLTGLGSASLASLASTNSTAATHSASGTSPASTNAKLAQAQAELQACETHLVTKERELDARRISIARDGLGARCRALIDCGWVWGEMGKQGLKTLQALAVDGLAQTAVPSHPTYASDNSSLTPSQSASQTAAQSVQTSHKGPTSKEHDTEADLTITLPPPHAISELTLPSGVRSQPPPNGDLVTQKHNGMIAKPVLAPAPRRKRPKRPRRPPSQHIAEVSDEGSDGPSSTSKRNRSANGDAGANPSPRTPFPTTRTANGTQETSSEDENPVGPFRVVENDPFEVIRKSMLGPSPSVPHLAPVPSVPSAEASGETSPSKTAFPSVIADARRGTLTPDPGDVKRERRTSMAFFGSLRGLFRKPKEREKVSTEWGEGQSSPKQNGKGAVAGWVTRTDARIKGKGGEADSDEDATPVMNVARGNSGARLRKGRPRGMHESGSLPSASQDGSAVGVDGWITDSHGPAGSSASTGAGLDRSRTRRGTMKRKKTSVADLRGSDQGHTDGEVDGRLPSERVSSKGKGRVEVVEEEEQARVLARRASVSKGVPNDTNAIAELDVQHRRAATTTATSSRKASEAHRRSASLSLVDTHVTFVSTSTSTSGGTSWRKPPPQFESAPRPVSPPPPKTASRGSTELAPKQHTRRHFGNGNASHAKNQSLMSIVADVTGPVPNEGEDKTRSLDIPRAPGSVLRETAEVGRRASLTMGSSVGQGQGQGRGVVKMPLRSALRNASRTPSPSPAPVEKKQAMNEDAVLRDSVSISSYETGRESLDGEEAGRVEKEPVGERERVPSPGPMFTFPPPPVDPPPMNGTVVRRKSVRVSLQPTFSPSPPVLYDDDGDAPGEDVWADSTSEEEVYRRARGLLSFVGKDKDKSDGKGKGRR